MYRFDPKKFAKQTKQQRLASENERIQNDNLKLRELVVNLAKANMELGGTGEGSKGSEGEGVSALLPDAENDSVAVEGACGELPSEQGDGAEGSKG